MKTLIVDPLNLFVKVVEAGDLKKAAPEDEPEEKPEGEEEIESDEEKAEEDEEAEENVDKAMAAFDDLIKRVVEYTRKTGEPGHWKYEYDKPDEKKTIHEFHRLTTMTPDALMLRARKIGNAEKMKHFFGMARASGRSDLAEYIRGQGVDRLKMSPDMFKSMEQAADEVAKYIFGDVSKGGTSMGAKKAWMKRPRKLSVPEQHQLRIARDTIRNPMKGKLLGGPSIEEAHEIVARLGG